LLGWDQTLLNYLMVERGSIDSPISAYDYLIRLIRRNNIVNIVFSKSKLQIHEEYTYTIYMLRKISNLG
jgi:hypothetical protein